MQYDDWGARSQRWEGIRSETVTVAGSRVNLLRTDGAPPAGAPPQLLLHGLGAAGAALLDLIGPFTAYGPVFAPDLPGSIFGETDTPRPAAARVENNARFVEALVAELGIETVVVHGWSMVAAIAIRFAADSPERVASLVLANPPLPARLTPIGRLGWNTLGRLTLTIALVVVRGLTRLLGRRTIEKKLGYLEGGEVLSSLAGLGGDPSRIPADTMAMWTDQLAEVRGHPETLGHAATSFASVVSSIFADQGATWGGDRSDRRTRARPVG